MTPAKILIVEDDDPTRLLLQAVVSRNHLVPVAAVDGRSAQALLASSVWDAILLDLRLPEISGAELLVDLDAGMKKRIVIVTAAPPTEWRRHLDGGIWGVVQKPFDLTELETALLACLADAKEIAGDQSATRVS